MASPQNTQVGQPYTVTQAAGVLLKAGQGCLQKAIAVLSTSGTLTVYDNTSASGTPIINAFPMTTGNVYELDVMFQIGCFVVIGGTGTAVLTVGP